MEEGAIEEVWRLSCTLEGHTADVRGVVVTEEGKLATCSRDDTLKLWTRRGAKGENGSGERAWAYEETAESKHDYHVASVAFAPKSEENPQGLVLTGTYDLTRSCPKP